MESLGLYQETGKGKASLTGSLLVALSGTGLVGVALFPCDTNCINLTFTGVMHEAATIFAASCSVLALFALSYGFRNDIKWRNFYSYTLLTGIAAALVWLSLLIMPLEGLAGLFEKFSVGISLLWMEIAAVRIYRFL